MTKGQNLYIFIFGGVVGIAVDAVTGGLYRLTPEQLTARMRQSGESAKPSSDLFVLLVPRASADWQKIGVLEKE